MLYVYNIEINSYSDERRSQRQVQAKQQDFSSAWSNEYKFSNDAQIAADGFTALLAKAVAIRLLKAFLATSEEDMVEVRMKERRPGHCCRRRE